MQELVELVKVCQDESALKRGRFLAKDEIMDPMPWELEEDGIVAERIFAFVIELLRYRIVYSACLSHSLPWRFAGLLTTNEADLRDHLADLEHWWATLQELDKAAGSSVEASRFRQDLAWPLWPWAREVFAQLEEYSFQKALVGEEEHSHTLRGGWRTQGTTPQIPLVDCSTPEPSISW